MSEPLDKDCEPVVYPPTSDELAAAVKGEARVVRPPDAPPATLPLSVSYGPQSVPPGVDLTAYTWRGPGEAGVQRGGLYGRWFVSLSDIEVFTSSISIGTIRPTPIRLDSCEFPDIKVNLTRTPIRATITPSGSVLNGLRSSTLTLRNQMQAAVGVNPHWSPMCNGHFYVESASVVVGCTIPDIRPYTSNLKGLWNGERTPLWSAGVSSLRWMWYETEFRPQDIWRQIDWTLTPDAPAQSGSWEFWPWTYRLPESGSRDKFGVESNQYNAYLNEIQRYNSIYAQPLEGYTGTNLGLFAGRLRGYITEVNRVRNRINADSNVIRGLHGKSQIRKTRITEFSTPPSLQSSTNAGLNKTEAFNEKGVKFDILAYQDSVPKNPYWEFHYG